MVVTDKQLKQFCCWFMITYMMLKVVIDQYTFGIFKALFLAIVLFSTFCYYRHKKFYLEDGILTLSILNFAIYILLECSFNSPSSVFTKRAVYEYIIYMLILFLGAYLVNEIDINYVYENIKIIGIILVLTSFAQLVTGNNLLFMRANGISRSIMANGMLIGISILILQYLYYLKRRTYLIALIILSFAAMFTTGSRGPMVAIIVAFVIQYLYHLSSGDRVKNFLILICVIVTALIFIHWFFNANIRTGNTLIDGWIVRFQKVLDWQHDAGNVGRLDKWNRWINVFHKNFWFGIGPSKTGSWGTASLGVTESGFIRHLVELGMVGTILYYFPIAFGIIYSLLHIRYMTKEQVSLVVLHLGIIVAVIIEDFVLQITEEITVAFFLWYALGVVYSIAQEAKELYYNTYRN